MDNAELNQTFPGLEDKRIRVKVIGVGGAGGNSVDRIKLDDLGEVSLAVVNTDTKSMSASPIQEKILIGRSLTRGLSSGGEVEIGRKAAEADLPLIEKLVDGVDLVFIIAGLGGGTGSGAAPVVAKAADAAGAVVLAFVTLPFTREGERRRNQAEEALEALRANCHAVIALPNDMLLQQVDENATVLEAFEVADQWVARGVKAVWSMLFQSGLMNVDFATLRNAFRFRGGKTLFSLGRGEGPDCVHDALADLELCPLLHLTDYKYSRKADSLIVNICGGPNLAMSQVNEIMDKVCDKFGSRQNTVIGAVIDEEMRDAICITVIGATGVDGSVSAARGVARRPGLQSVPSARAEAEAEVARMAERAGRVAQHEFDFQNGEERGFFGSTEANLYNGEDLDVPTFLRRGIRVQV